MPAHGGQRTLSPVMVRSMLRSVRVVPRMVPSWCS
jgi:hypothetical protein